MSADLPLPERGVPNLVKSNAASVRWPGPDGSEALRRLSLVAGVRPADAQGCGWMSLTKDNRGDDFCGRIA